jgi:hypothetical protein
LGFLVWVLIAKELLKGTIVKAEAAAAVDRNLRLDKDALFI